MRPLRLVVQSLKRFSEWRPPTKLIKASMLSSPADAPTATKVLSEGAVTFVTEYTTPSPDPTAEIETTFYNPVQVFNRDISLLATQTFVERLRKERPQIADKGIMFYDALSASG